MSADTIARGKDTRAIDPIPHGTRGGYTNWGCRCDECSSVQSSYFRDWQTWVRRHGATRPHWREDLHRELAAERAAQQKNEKSE